MVEEKSINTCRRVKSIEKENLSGQKCVAKIASWDLAFADVLNLVSEDRKDNLRKVLNYSKGKAKKLIQDRLNTFVEADFDARIENIDEKLMERESGY